MFSSLESIETFTRFVDLWDARVAEAKIKDGGPKNKIVYNGPEPLMRRVRGLYGQTV